MKSWIYLNKVLLKLIVYGKYLESHVQALFLIKDKKSRTLYRKQIRVI